MPLYREYIRESTASFAFTTDRERRHTLNQAHHHHRRRHCPKGAAAALAQKEETPGKHDFIKQKQRDRETNERHRVGEFCFRYAEDMNSFSSLPSGCLDACFTIVSLLVSKFPPCPVLSHALKLNTIHNTQYN